MSTTQVKTFVKKPVAVEAIQWDGTEESTLAVVSFLQMPNIAFAMDTDEFVIPTLEDGKLGQAKHVASKGDWIIKGVKGEFYPCKPDIFEATYQKDVPTDQPCCEKWL